MKIKGHPAFYVKENENYFHFPKNDIIFWKGVHNNFFASHTFRNKYIKTHKSLVNVTIYFIRRCEN